MVTTTTQPRASGDGAQPSASPASAAPLSQSEGHRAEQSGSARAYTMSLDASGWYCVISGIRIVAMMQGRLEAATLCRRLNGGR